MYTLKNINFNFLFFNLDATLQQNKLNLEVLFKIIIVIFNTIVLLKLNK